MIEVFDLMAMAGSIERMSMLDVVFIMLIFFIVTVLLVNEVGVEVTRPRKQPRARAPARGMIQIFHMITPPSERSQSVATSKG